MNNTTNHFKYFCLQNYCLHIYTLKDAFTNSLRQVHNYLTLVLEAPD